MAKIINRSKEDNCKELWKMLRFQYKPRDKILMKRLKGETLKKYKRMNYCKKISVIDKFESNGYFE